MAGLTGREIADQIRRALRGEISVRLVDPGWTWDAVFAGDVAFWFDDWHIAFFNDCDGLDYVERAATPSGRTWSFANEGGRETDCDGNVIKYGDDPVFYSYDGSLSQQEQDQLYKLLKAAT